ncbi:hypothetical protein ACTJIJ_11725 [Niabella sp. 22666]|uniref:hypothetical protein n=1 Tax=Niabella sp. 22666 TaxID=3453954 RepID=UPI003F828BFF
MGRNQTSFTSKTAPKGKGSSKNTKTKIIEAIGLSGWEKLESFLLNEGAEKLCESLSKLKPKDFVVAFDKLTEYVKPKLSRQTIVGEKDSPINIEIIKTYASDGNKTDAETNTSI